MSIEYISSFNSGELSDWLDSRSDIEKYRSGCAKLENMYVLPQGGVERRTGSEYMSDAISGDAIRLIPFDFSEDDSYIIEFGEDVIRVHDGDGYTGVEIAHDYTPAELPKLKYKRVFDILYLVCDTHPVMQLSRTALSPLTFTLNELDFIYPPLLEENTDFDSLVETQPQYWEPNTDYNLGQQTQDGGDYWVCTAPILSGGVPSANLGSWDQIYTESISVETDRDVILIATEEIFNPLMVGAYWNMKHERTENTIADTGSLGNLQYSKEIFVGTGQYSINITNVVSRYGSGYYNSTSIIEEWTGSSWVNIATYNNAGTFVKTGTGSTAGSRLRVRNTFNTIFDGVVTYSIGLESNRRVSGELKTATELTSQSLDVSFSNWAVTTGGTSWTGVVELEKSTDNEKTWTVETTVGDTYGVDSKNFTVPSPSKEGGQTFIRLKFTPELTSILDFTISNTSLYAEGLAIITEYIDPNTVKALIINQFGSPAPTKRWTEGAFSNYRGFPKAIEQYEDRIVYSGTDNDPATVWMSIVGDFQNYQLGPNDDEAIKFTPSTPERTQWLLTKKNLNQGTIGGILNNYSIDSDTTITPSTVKASTESSFGCEDVQAVFANDVSLYVQRLGKKLRELVYNWENDKFDSNDLTILASHITGSGLVELAIQKTPDQIIWGLTSDGTLSALTYERNEGVAGWHRHSFGGIVKSIAIRPASGEDELWLAIERDNGVFLERVGSRTFSDDLLDAWFVDSGVETILSPIQDMAMDVNRMIPQALKVTGTAERVDGDYYFVDMFNNRPRYECTTTLFGTSTLFWNGTLYWQFNDGDPTFFTQPSNSDWLVPTDATWYSPEGVPGQPAITPAYTINVTKTDHGLSGGDFIRITDADALTDTLNENVFMVSEIATTSEFKLKSVNGNFINYDVDALALSDDILVEYAGLSATDGTYSKNGLYNDKYRYDFGPYLIADLDSIFGEISIGELTEPPTTYYITNQLNSKDPLAPSEDGWGIPPAGTPPTPKVSFYYAPLAISGSMTEVSNTWSGLDHLEGETVQLVGDGGYDGYYEVSGGEVVGQTWYNQSLIGTPYTSLIQPMFVEMVGIPAGKHKNIGNVVMKFLRTSGALVGVKNNKRVGDGSKVDIRAFDITGVPDDIDAGEYKTEEVIFRTNEDPLGEPLTPFNGEKLVYLNDNWDRLKGIYAVQNLPLPMTVLSMAISINDGERIR